MKSITSGGWKSYPTAINQETFYENSYPEINFKWHTFSALQTNISQTFTWFTQNISLTPSDIVSVETIWGTPTNAYNKILADWFQILWNFYSNSNFWNNTNIVSWWYNASDPSLWTYTMNNTVRVVSIEKLKPWYIIGETIKFMPAYGFWKWAVALTHTFSNWFVTYTFKLIRTNGTMVSLWSWTSPVNSVYVGWWNAQWAYGVILWWLVVLSWAWVVSQSWDRIIVEINMSCTLALSGAWGFVASPMWMIVYTWYAGSNLSLSASVDAHRPFQISIL